MIALETIGVSLGIMAFVVATLILFMGGLRYPGQPRGRAGRRSGARDDGHRRAASDRSDRQDTKVS